MMSKRTDTKYPKSVKPLEGVTLLKPGSNNKKLGWNVTAKRWKGAKLFSLTLVERRTCPTSCHHWDDCYGNNMPFAHRFDPSADGFLAQLESEIRTLCDKHKLVVIRLHVLGDFYSQDYIKFWMKLLNRIPNLRIFGYTGHDWDSEMGQSIRSMNMLFRDECVIRFSSNEDSDKPATYYGWFAAKEDFTGKSFDCPEQIGLSDSCASCGACWQVPKTVRFMSH